MERVLVVILCEALFPGLKELADRILKEIGSIPYLIVSEGEEPVETLNFGYPILPLRTGVAGSKWRSLALGKAFLLSQTIGKEWILTFIAGRSSMENAALIERVTELKNVHEQVVLMKAQNKKAYFKKKESTADFRITLLSSAFLNHSFPTVPQLQPKGQTQAPPFGQVWTDNIQRLGVEKLILSELPVLVSSEIPDVDMRSALYQDVERLGDGADVSGTVE